MTEKIICPLCSKQVMLQITPYDKKYYSCNQAEDQHNFFLEKYGKNLQEETFYLYHDGWHVGKNHKEYYAFTLSERNMNNYIIDPFEYSQCFNILKRFKSLNSFL